MTLRTAVGMHGSSLWKRLTERKLVQWGLGYIAGAILVLEVGDILSDAFAWPPAAMRVLFVLVLFAFFAVLIVAWFHGEKGHQRVTGTEAVLLAVVLLAAGGASWRVGARAPAGEAVTDPSPSPSTLLPVADSRAAGPSLAVLPFVNIGGDEQNEYFSDGITEDIIAQLSRIDGLRVISRTSVMQYKATQKTIRQIGEELGVTAVLEGSVRRSGDQVRVVAQLIDAQTDEHLWAETYDRGIQDILKIQADVAQQIADALQAQLSPVQVAELDLDEDVDPEAYMTYLQARQLARSAAPEDRVRAAQLYRTAVTLDTGFVKAYSALAETFVPENVGELDVRMDQLPDVDAIVEKALAMVPTAPEVQTLMVRKALDRWDIAAAEAAARTAVEQHPNYAAARHWYAVVLGRQGRHDEALRELRIARSLDPHSAAINADLGELQYAAGRFDEAIAQLRATVAGHPDNAHVRVNLALALDARGDRDAALAEMRRAAELAPRDPLVLGQLGQLLARAGQQEEARRILQELIERSGRQRIPPSAVAQIYAGLGEKDQAVSWLRRAANERSAALVSPRVNRVFHELRDHPELAAILRMAPAPPPPTPDSLRVRAPGR